MSLTDKGLTSSTFEKAVIQNDAAKRAASVLLGRSAVDSTRGAESRVRVELWKHGMYDPKADVLLHPETTEALDTLNDGP